ncbi:hypothetical protein EV211_14013 [Aminicella lysinilytica]|uniref:Uncharacterized protein n=1 Tax=Aminicella lysinilytica TaxID=433323 RepID=A0A4R6PZC1_9FIRM|nr:hypothetical protein EV211_14013 [Aminicella lysinilytica]
MIRAGMYPKYWISVSMICTRNMYPRYVTKILDRALFVGNQVVYVRSRTDCPVLRNKGAI